MLIAQDRLIELSEIFKLLGDPTRLAILIACMDEEKSVGDIVLVTQASQSLVSHHLRLLRGARLVRPRRAGRQVFYKAHDAHISCTLKDMIDHVHEEDEL
ncbi:MAG: ArsR/SmtB family transcription factor [Terasakiella sp.]|uniref:ArsR/SmtB family transcription factor n=1 Tax=unclassified Terasakiella TaxID=2614952 RepID=UPI003AFFD333